MAARVPIRAGKVSEINGISYSLITTKGKELAYLAVATERDGLIDGPEDVLEAAERWRAEMATPIRRRIVDKNKDKNTST